MGRKKRRGSLLSGVSPMTVASGVTSSGAAGGSVQGPLWSLYNLQESSGTRVDQMGNNDMDVLVNNPGRATGISDDGYALNLDGTQYVKSTNDIIDNFSGIEKLSVNFWFYLNNSPGYGEFWGLGDNESGLEINYNSPGGGELNFRLSVSGTHHYLKQGNHVLSTETWFMYTAWMDLSQSTSADKANVYINGASKGTWDSGSLPSVTPTLGEDRMMIGVGKALNASSIIDGRIDQVSIFKDYVLTADDIAFLYGSGTPPTSANIINRFP